MAVLGPGRQRLSATAIRKTALLIDGDSYLIVYLWLYKPLVNLTGTLETVLITMALKAI